MPSFPFQIGNLSYYILAFFKIGLLKLMKKSVLIPPLKTYLFPSNLTLCHPECCLGVASNFSNAPQWLHSVPLILIPYIFSMFIYSLSSVRVCFGYPAIFNPYDSTFTMEINMTYCTTVIFTGSANQLMY